ncbi:MAG: RidA family protein [Fulvimarina manganoxydans]|uniref:Rid family hydrolase n=1 Tax=Fulvimarina manganoxydans TaxID=937218 RepID=UPI00235764E7|nr:Rid family hydrolase [Fulvimarina manganoxydans]MCK5932970.1 RidA family protein [Fulvimarina manganoxydans]
MSVTRIPIEEMPSKSKVAIYRLPGGGGFLWGVATSRDLSLDLPGQAADALAVIDGYLTDAGLDRTCIVRCEVIVTDHDRKPEFDEVWKAWMPEGHGPVRSFVQSIMPEGDQVEIIVTAALPTDQKA